VVSGVLLLQAGAGAKAVWTWLDCAAYLPRGFPAERIERDPNFVTD
jgi:hypothetical protein